MIDQLVHRFLKFLPPETAHNLAKFGMKRLIGAPGPFISNMRPNLFGNILNNPLGLAAGFDKNGELAEQAIQYGFGYVEVGSVTYRGGKGNPRPRMFRVDGDDIMNRMGLNGDPASVVEYRLRGIRTPFGVNIAKTHDPAIIGDRAIEDVVNSFNILKNIGIYTVINISCPNTKEGKTFEDPNSLSELLKALVAVGKTRPMLVKLSPLLAYNWSHLDRVIDVCLDNGIDGFVVANTYPETHHKYGKGGRSGSAVYHSAGWIIYQINRRKTGKAIIAVGGIFRPLDMLAYLRSGATAFQAYNGFVRGPCSGARFAHVMNAQFEANYDHYRPTD